ncbi:hypothetical protein AB6A40_005298 [Gnathostoma spinigerum]|uniref:ShKT domain-containing protein n=1 Tax=Gnathostoma spinigerum TaxID=75299 RepID=A0ABD6EMP3_9BILA
MKTLVLTAAWLFAFTVSVIAEECRDENASCKVWADGRQCDLNPGYMKKYCKKSCKVCTEDGGGSKKQGDCKDSDVKCKSWAERGECEANPKWMLANCKKSCKQCKGGEEGDCQDSNANCKSWAERGECEANPTWMLANCKKSCKQCKGSEDGDCKDSHQSCEAWASSGECENNPTWMNANCKKSCKQCKGGTTTDRKKPKKPSVGGGDLPDVGDINCGGSMSNEVRTLLVNGHNKRRSDMAQGRMVTWGSVPVQSGANVQAFTWDCELERKSEEWAQYCSTNHSPNREDRSENLHWEMGYPRNDALKVAENAMVGWWDDENREDGFGYAPYTDWSNYSGNNHLITMAWAKSNKMGCFVKTDCPDMRYIVCQYKIRGNWIGEAVMEVGPACSKCPSGTTCHQKSGLCVSA